MLIIQLALLQLAGSGLAQRDEEYSSACRREPRVKVSGNNVHLRNLSSKLYSLWAPTQSLVNFAWMSNFERNRCLSIVTNYMGLDIKNLNHPIILRKVVPAVIYDPEITPDAPRRITPEVARCQATWVLEKAGNFSADPTYFCYPRVSKFDNRRSTYYPWRCPMLEPLLISPRSKPWLCEVTVDLFPPALDWWQRDSLYLSIQKNHIPFKFTGKFHPIKYPALWRFPMDRFGEAHNFFSNRCTSPPIHFLLVQTQPWKAYTHHSQLLFLWIKDTQMHRTLWKSKNWVDGFEFLLVEMNNLNNLDLSWEIFSIQYITSVPSSWTYSLIPFDGDVTMKNLNTIFDRSASSQISFWKVANNPSTLKPKYCDPSFYRMNSHHALRKIIEKVDQVLDHILFQELAYIMSNASNVCEKELPYYKYSALVFSLQFVGTISPGSHLNYLVSYPNPSDALNVVTCLKKGHEQMPFMELIASYDKYVWVLITVSVFALATVPKIFKYFTFSPTKLSTKSSVYRSISLINFLIEQGGRFPADRFAGSDRIRLVLGSALLMSIIISNGYKNDNIYRMILRPQPIRYINFQELVEDGRVVYTSTFVIGSPQTKPLNISGIVIGQQDKENNSFFFHTFPDARWFTAVTEVRARSFVELYDSREERQVKSLILKNTRGNLSHNTLEAVVMHAHSVLRNKNSSIVGRTNKTEIRLTKIYMNVLEEGEFMSGLENCAQNKFSYIVPIPFAHRMVRRFKSMGTYMLKNNYLQRSVDFCAQGYINKYFLSRIDSYKQSGLGWRWTAILTAFANSKNHPTENKMDTERETKNHPDGKDARDFFVVFCVLGVGLLLGVLVFLIEILLRNVRHLASLRIFLKYVTSIQSGHGHAVITNS